MPENKNLQKTKTNQLETLISEVQKRLKDGSILQAMEVCYRAHEVDPTNVTVLRQLVAITLHLQSTDQALVCLHKLVALEPKNVEHYDQIAQIHHQANEPEKAAQIYQLLVVRLPDFPDAHYNVAYYVAKSGRFQKAIESYKKALQHGIKNPEEIYLNLAVISADHLRQETQAQIYLEQALSLNPEYLPALYNMANLYEDRGDKAGTLRYFEKLLSLQPQNAKVLARIVHLSDDTKKAEPYVRELEKLVDVPELDYGDKIDALYALGKAFDDAKSYDKAFAYYTQANTINALEMPAYNETQTEQYFDAIKQTFSANWMADNTLSNDAEPIFICGMFRSGSTLVEQMLASHPDITAGGERDFFTHKLHNPDFSYPHDIKSLSTDNLDEMARLYIDKTRQLFPNAHRVTDKRPDNILYLGLIKALFPNAKFICTKRHLLDNCLSVYFVRLARSMNYAVNLDSIAHYYAQQEQLLQHWMSLFGADIQIVDYDKLVASPKPGITHMLKSLGLDWNDQCLNFHQLDNRVKTASVWQVRKPLFTQSTGRWKNYQPHLAKLIEVYQAHLNQLPQ